MHPRSIIGKGIVHRWDHKPIPEKHTPMIAKGEQYVEEFGETPAFQSGNRYCRACAIVAGMALLHPGIAAKAEGGTA